MKKHGGNTPIVPIPKVAKRQPPTIGLRVSDELRRLVEVLAATLTLRDGQRWTMTSVLEEAIRRMARTENIT